MSAGGPDPAAGGAAGAGRAPRRIYVTDCEGPLTRNDNAQEIAEHFIPDGAELFARLSKYDDFLADVVHKPGYNAGDTLRLLPPFLKAFEVTDDGVEAFSAEGVLVVPGAIEALTEIAALLPAFIISTSYTPYLKALCELSGFPLSNVRCTELSLDAWLMPEDEKAWLRDKAARVMERSLIEIPDEARSADDLAPTDAVTVAQLDDLFWAQMDGRVSGELVAAELAKAFAGGGRDGVEAAVRAWPKPKKGEKPTCRAGARVGLVAEEPEALAEASAAARRSVRGERIARLG